MEETGKYIVRDTSFPVKFRDDSVLLDITDKQAVESFILTERPDFIVNCIGVLIKGSQANPANAIYINSYFPHQLSALARQLGGKLIHVSTDCVFSGEKGGYTEDDFKDARDVYGLSKALGEVVNSYDLTLRTSIIGPELKSDGEGLLHWFFNQCGDVKGYTRAFWSGVTTLELARSIDCAMMQNVTGLYHVTGWQKISKFDLLQLCKKTWGLDSVNILPHEGKKVDKSLVITRNDFDFQVRDYERMLMDAHEFMNAHGDLYQSCLY